MVRWCILLVFLFPMYQAIAQGRACTVAGQDARTAIRVCEDTVFRQETFTTPYCGDYFPYPLSECQSGPFTWNPFWYKMTCYKTGKLGFKMNHTNPDFINGNNWVLFDITGKDAGEIYTSPVQVKAAIWESAGNGPKSKYTGAASWGGAIFSCDSEPKDTSIWAYTQLIDVQKGHDYLLLISSAAAYYPGFNLIIGGNGGNAMMVDTSLPAVKKVWTDCAGKKARVLLNKIVQVNSIAADGSDFSLSAESASVIAAAPLSTVNNYTDTIELTFSNPLPPGNYVMFSQQGVDGHTLLDPCERVMLEDTRIEFEVLAPHAASLDKVTAVQCGPRSVELTFTEPVRCSSIASDGSDFRISGPSAVVISRAVVTECHRDFTSSVKLELSSSVSTGGNYSVQVQQGSDNNTILNDCNIPVFSGSTVDFTVVSKVDAGFTLQQRKGCVTDTIDFFHPGGAGINDYTWKIGNTVKKDKSFLLTFDKPGQQQVSLTVTNGSCSATKESTFTIEEKIKAAIEAPSTTCPERPVSFVNRSTGKIKSWLWDLGNGFQSSQPDPPSQYYKQESSGASVLNIQLVIADEHKCRDTVQQHLKILSNCSLAVPNAFTPNNDGRNDRLFPMNTQRAGQLDFCIYNRFGQLIFRSNDPTKSWDGTWKGIPQPTGSYPWAFSYMDLDTGEKKVMRGVTMLIR